MANMRVGGLASGMDIDSIVEKLMQAEKMPLNKLEQQKQTFEWERDAYREVNKALSSFDDFLFSDYRLVGNFYNKSVTSTNSNLVTATATAAATGTLSIDGVSQLAKSAQGVGKTIMATGSTKLSDLDPSLTANSTFTLNAINSEGKLGNREFTISANETIDSLVSKINKSDVGVTALFENGKLSITAKNMGNLEDGAEVSVSGDKGAALFSALGFSSTDLATGGQNAVFSINGIATERSSNTFSINGYNVTLNSTFNNESTQAEYTKNMYNNYVIASDQVGKANDDVQDAIDAVEQADIKLNATDSVVRTAISNIEPTIEDMKNDKLFSFLLNLGENSADKLKELSSKLNFSSGEELKQSIEGLFVEGNDNIFTQAEVNQIIELFISESEDAVSLTDEANAFSGLANSLKDKSDAVFADTAAYFSANKDLTTALADQKTAQDNLAAAEATFTDAIEKYGVTYDKVNNKVIVNETNADGEVIQTSVDVGTYLNGKINSSNTTNPVTLTSSTNVDDMVEKIKKFVDTYNGLVDTINGKLKETRYRDYQPLTDEQREEMTEDQIEKWEEKAKSGLLRSDSILSNGLFNLRGTFSESIKGLSDTSIDSFFEIGITTTTKYSDGGKLKIDEEKLREAIEKNADQVAEIFTKTGTKPDASKGITEDTRGLAQKLRDHLSTFTKNIEAKAGKPTSTNQTFTLGKSIVRLEDRIEAWKDKLTSIEDRYWRQFTAMEQAISKANSQASLFMPSM